MQGSDVLPTGITVFERGWLSANNILIVGPHGTALIDSGYCSHAAQTVALVRQSLGEKPLDRLLNTHLHSDHCGGNAVLQQSFPNLQTWIPPGQAAFVREWDPYALSYVPTGQECPPFRLDGLLQPGAELVLGDHLWQVHAAPGHDPHSVILFEPEARVLVSADALWQNGFGVVFPELEGERAFEEVASTLDLIESLMPRIVIPGHGGVFDDVTQALALARKRLDSFIRNPQKHAQHAAKVLLKFKLLELQDVAYPVLAQWAEDTAYFRLVRERYFPERGMQAWIEQLTEDLVRVGAAQRDADRVLNA
ncbi:MAG TPA: MBL fold metallo-hydrolase [Burkholderiaceae bacterium]|nr:MBL fold metallo-hydrolase [Burkholderiaceae bacterium]